MRQSNPLLQNQPKFYTSSLYPPFPYYKDNTINYVSGIFVVFGVYLLAYYLLRDPASSEIPFFVLIIGIIICFSFALYLQLKQWYNTRYEPNYIRTQQQDHINKIFSNTRQQHSLTTTRPNLQQGLSEGYNDYEMYENTYLHRIGPLGSVLRKGEILYDNRIQFKDTTLRANTAKLPLPEIPIGSKSEKELPVLGVSNKYTSYQGDVRDYEEISSNSLALEQYEKMGIKNKLPRWVENIRYWMGYTFIPAILKRHQQNLEQLTKLLNYYDKRLVFNRLNELYMKNVDPIMWEDLYDIVIKQGNLPFQLGGMGIYMTNEEQIKSKLKDLVEERDNLENYFRLRENSLSRREYVIERLKQLQPSLIAEYKNNGGMAWNSEPWNSSLPKDSDVK